MKDGSSWKWGSRVMPAALLAIAASGVPLAGQVPPAVLQPVPSALILHSNERDPSGTVRLPLQQPAHLAVRPAQTGLQFEAPVTFTPVYEFPSFHSEYLDQQLARYAAFIDANGVPDVLLVGSSRTLQGIDPIALQDALADQGYAGMTVYNFSINGATARVVDVMLQQVLTPDQLPKLIIWGDGSRAFNSGRPDATYAVISASPGWQQLTTGDRPIRFQPNLALRPVELPDTFAACVDVPLPDSSVYTTSAVPFSTIPPCGMDNLNPAPIRLNTNSSVAEPPPAAIVESVLTSHGFLVIDTQFNPDTYYQQYPRVRGEFDGSYIPFELEGEQTDATRSIAEFARQQGIDLVFVNLPLSGDYLDATRSGYESEFRRYMRDLANREEFIFIDLSRAWLYENSYFQDPSHINRYGAKAVAEQLAIEPAIPWSRAAE